MHTYNNFAFVHGPLIIIFISHYHLEFNMLGSRLGWGSRVGDLSIYIFMGFLMTQGSSSADTILIGYIIGCRLMWQLGRQKGNDHLVFLHDTPKW